MRRALAPWGVRMTGPRLPIAAWRTARDSSRESAPLAKRVSSNAANNSSASECDTVHGLVGNGVHDDPP
jgi:hypothetical protein